MLPPERLKANQLLAAACRQGPHPAHTAAALQDLYPRCVLEMPRLQGVQNGALCQLLDWWMLAFLLQQQG